MKRHFSHNCLAAIIIGLFATASQAQTFTFDNDNQGWVYAGFYDGTGLNPIFRKFSVGPARFHPYGYIVWGSGSRTLPSATTTDRSGSWVHVDLNSPILTGEADWQTMSRFSFDINKDMVSSDNSSAYVQAWLKIRDPYDNESYVTDHQWREISLWAAGGWDTHVVDVSSLGITPGSTVVSVNLRFLFQSGTRIEGYIGVDNVKPLGSNLSDVIKSARCCRR